jgi:predicted phage-related endonuclease
MSGIDRELRQQGIGASEMAALWGLHPYVTRYTLQMRKKHPAAFETPETDWQAIGHILEEPCLQIYSLLTKRRARYLNVTQRHPKYPVVGSPDGLCEDEPRGVELKVYADESRRFFGPHQDELPDFMKVQCHVYMAMLDIPVWDVFVLLAGRPQIYTVWRDRELEDAMIEQASEFWCRYIEGDEELPIDDPDAAERYLQWRYPTHARPDLRIATTEEMAILDELAEVRRQAGTLIARRKILELEIKGAIKEKEGLTFAGGKFTWRRTKDSQETNWESLGLGLLNAHIPDAEKREAIIDFYTRTKPGARRIYFKHKNLKEEEDDE